MTGKIIRGHEKDIDYKGYTHQASADAPQYEIKSGTIGYRLPGRCAERWVPGLRVANQPNTGAST